MDLTSIRQLRLAGAAATLSDDFDHRRHAVRLGEADGIPGQNHQPDRKLHGLACKVLRQPLAIAALHIAVKPKTPANPALVMSGCGVVV
jgi:hypothetical protein